MTTQRILIVHAQPEPTSLTRHLVDVARQALTAAEHIVTESDLYGLGWKAVFDADDFPTRLDPDRLSFVAESGHAYGGGLQTADVASEQAKLLAADAVLFVFPLWWFGMPAIMKGWVDRVFAYGLAYGFRNAGNAHRYGEGGLAGRRAMLAVITGGPAADYGPRGINGELDELLFPITHGMLHYTGMQVLPTYALHGAGRIDDAGVQAAIEAWRARLVGLFDDVPMPFRAQNGGDYPDRHVLADNVAPGEAGLRVHWSRRLAQ